ncbi:SAM-dependent methyltransferase [Nocardia sp. NPDC051030]|uniref:SAM-dependent methyltransferase n=1 Tax=Nocardia sp. NPDC051030 TaxID=3155162 RepID=UPI003421E178
MAQSNRAPIGVDPTRPNAARVYNFMLDGKDNYEADRVVAERMLAIAPDTKTLAWFSRRFLLNAVRAAAQEGIEQFIDIGAGIPISPNVHEVAQEFEPSARVVAVDHDPVVFAHTNALLAGEPGVTSMLADIRATDLIERLRTEGGIDFDQRVAILIVGVLHFIMDDENPAELVARFRDVMAPGSLLAFTHACTNTHPDFIRQSSGDLASTPAQVAFRTTEQVEPFLEGFEVIEPGVVPVQEWLNGELPSTRLVVLGGVGRKN